jgi:hypothetical protein
MGSFPSIFPSYLSVLVPFTPIYHIIYHNMMYQQQFRFVEIVLIPFVTAFRT